MQDRKQILIVGAGPVGLTLAINLAKLGVPFRLIEKRKAHPLGSKALAINCLSLQTFAAMGILETVIENGAKVSDVNIHYSGKPLFRIRLGRLDVRFPYFVTQPQFRTVQALTRCLESLGGGIEWSTELLSLSDRGDEVETETLEASGEKRTGSYAYVVGCDGKESQVRRAMGLAFSGIDYGKHLLLADVKLDWKGKPGEAYYHIHPDTFLIFIPLPNGYHRIVAERDGPFPKGQEPRLADIEERLRRFGPPEARIWDLKWISQAPLYMRTLGALQSGRSFLAGDAAHLFSPIGGMGMNTGIQDAFNLAWKLAYVLHGFAHPGLLSTYNGERLPAIKAVAAATDRSTLLITGKERSPEAVGIFLPRMKNRKAFRKDLPYGFSGLAQKYPSSGIIKNEGTSGFAGSLAPFHAVDFLDPREEQNRLAHGSSLLAIRPERSDQGYQALSDLTRWIHARRFRFLALALVDLENGGHPVRIPESLRGLVMPFDKAVQMARFLGSPGDLIWVRPDGHIGYSGSLHGVEEFKRYLEEFSRPSGELPGGRFSEMAAASTSGNE